MEFDTFSRIRPAAEHTPVNRSGKPTIADKLAGARAHRQAREHGSRQFHGEKLTVGQFNHPARSDRGLADGGPWLCSVSAVFCDWPMATGS